jgi:SAM-dependent methyltransferase
LLPAPGRLTLDLGCGEGRLGRILRERGHRVMAFDASPTLVGLAVAHDDPQPAAVADVARLPLPDAVADLAIAFMSLHDVDDMPAAVHEAGRVLVPGGRLCVAIVHPLNSAGTFTSEQPESAFVIGGSYLQEFRYADDIERDGIAMTFHSHHRPLEAYSRALEDAGFVIEVIREPSDPAMAGVDARWGRVPLFLHVRAVRA